MWQGLQQALLSAYCGFSSLIVLLCRGWNYLISLFLMPDCSPVSQWPPVSGLLPWEMQRRRRRRVERDARGEGLNNHPERECTRIPMSQNSSLSAITKAPLLLICHRCHTISWEQRDCVVLNIPHVRCKKRESKVVPTSICTICRGDAAEAMWSAEQL